MASPVPAVRYSGSQGRSRTKPAPPGALPWYALAPRALREHVAVFGHWAAHGARVTDRIIATDSACVWGGALTAVRLDDRAVFAVPAVEPSAG